MQLPWTLIDVIFIDELILRINPDSNSLNDMVDLCITKANGKREPIQCQKRTKKFKLKTRNLKTKFER